jgi:hypothetical protein
VTATRAGNNGAARHRRDVQRRERPSAWKQRSAFAHSFASAGTWRKEEPRQDAPQDDQASGRMEADHELPPIERAVSARCYFARVGSSVVDAGPRQFTRKPRTADHVPGLPAESNARARQKRSVFGSDVVENCEAVKAVWFTTVVENVFDRLT